MTAATSELNDMVAVLERAGWNCDVVYWDDGEGTVDAMLCRMDRGPMEYLVFGRGRDKASASEDLLRNWAAGKGAVPSASSPEELEIKIASLNLNRRASRIF